MNADFATLATLAAPTAAAAAAAANATIAGTAAADHRHTVLVVDDTPANVNLLANVLDKTYRVQVATSGQKALDLVLRQPPDLIVLDVMMPGLDGYEVCRRLKADPGTQALPVLFLTALTRPEDETRGFECGAADFIHKPFNPVTVLARVATHLQLRALHEATRQRARWLQTELDQRLRDVDQLRDATLHVMVSFAEFRDQETGNHVRRTQECVRLLARWLREQGLRPELDEARIDQLARSAPLHDIGKIAIPDGILLKPGPLTAEEMTIMRSHAMHGWEMLRRAADRMGPEGALYLSDGMDIARHHHERWDGGGYPDRLAGEDIPLSARLMAVADVYDALISRRPYKPPMPREQALQHVRAESGRHFDPLVVRALLANAEALASIAERWRD